MHESTVSRVTSNKYMATPRGIFELKYFFSAAIASAGGGDAHSAEAVRHRIKVLIDAENPDDILSDDTIVKMLKDEGIDIARRTVAKYRGVPAHRLLRPETAGKEGRQGLKPARTPQPRRRAGAAGKGRVAMKPLFLQALGEAVGLRAGHCRSAVSRTPFDLTQPHAYRTRAHACRKRQAWSYRAQGRRLRRDPGARGGRQATRRKASLCRQDPEPGCNRSGCGYQFGARFVTVGSPMMKLAGITPYSGMGRYDQNKKRFS